jgi:hypothetical protein
MTGWKMLDSKGKIQQTVFSDETSVQVDFSSGKYSINGKTFEAPEP